MIRQKSVLVKLGKASSEQAQVIINDAADKLLDEINKSEYVFLGLQFQVTSETSTSYPRCLITAVFKEVVTRKILMEKSKKK